MASLLNNASLLLNPAGSIIAYEEDKILSVLPSNGTGDFTFSGGDGGTRVNQQGYIEVTPANLASDSNSFNNNNSFTKTGSLSGPFNSTDGNILTPTGTSEKYSQIASLTVPANTVFTFSVYAKYLQNTQIALRCVYSNGAQDQSTIFNLQTNTVVGSVPGAHSNPQILSVGGGWFRYSIDINSNTPPAFPLLFRVNAANNGSIVFTPASGDGFYISSAQVNTGGLKPYQPTTDRLNYPRITYQNGRGALLSEPQRTNIVTNSEDATQQGLNNMSATGSTAISPDGTQNADTITPTAGTSDHYLITNATSVTNGASFTLSAFIKKKDSDYVHFGSGGAGSFGSVAYSFLTNTFFNINGPSAYSVVNFGNGWIRLTITGTTGGTDLRILLTPTDSSGARTFNANGTDGLYVWGLQIEAGSFPTSYIPTTSATVTRPLDQSSVTNLESNGLTGTNVGTLYLSVANTANSYDGGAINAKVGGGGNFPYNYMILDSTGTNNRVRIFNGGAQTAAYTFTETFAKIAVTADGTNSSVFVNGIKKGTSSGLLAGIEEITQEATGAGLRYANATYTTALSDAQCQELTTVRSGSGGNISYYGPYTIHTFTGSATFTPSFTGPVEVLVVAGGGGGGSANDSYWEGGGGGGAGGLLYASSYGVSQSTGITVTIGAGGSGGKGVNNPISTNGSNTSFGGLTAIGGGRGAGSYYTATIGGSGGGGEGYPSSDAFGAAGTLGQGNSGGNGSQQASLDGSGGGGGGAGQVGSNALTGAPYTAGNGGNGLPYSISGFSTYYAGGGGGKAPGSAASSTLGGVGGLGGGGNGGVGGGSALGASGVNYTGGGGGGGMSTSTATGNGGDGVVIVKYLT